MIAAGWSAYAWSQRQYYVGAHDGQVAIYKGLHQNVLGKSLSRRYEQVDIVVADLPALDQEKVGDTIFAEDVAEAHEVVDRLRQAAALCRAERMTAAEPPPEPSPKPTPDPRGAYRRRGHRQADDDPGAHRDRHRDAVADRDRSRR